MDAIKNDSYATYMAWLPRLIKAGVDRGGTYLSHLDMISWTEPELGNKKEINIVSWHIKDLTLSKQNTAENLETGSAVITVCIQDGIMWPSQMENMWGSVQRDPGWDAHQFEQEWFLGQGHAESELKLICKIRFLLSCLAPFVIGYKPSYLWRLHLVDFSHSCRL